MGQAPDTDTHSDSLHIHGESWWDMDQYNNVVHRRNFISFVNRVLLLHKVSTIRKFRLSFVSFCKHYDGSYIHAWVSAVLLQGALEELHLHVARKVPVNLPLCLFTYANSCKRLFFGCLLLEELILQDCIWEGEELYIVPVVALQSLIVQNITLPNYRNTRVLINAPSLTYFKYAGFVTGLYWMEKNLDALVKAEINAVKGNDLVIDLFRALANVKFSPCSNYRSLFMSLVKYLTHCQPNLPILHNVTRLELSFYTIGGCAAWELLPHLLAILPQLDTLVFPVGLEDDCDKHSSEDWYPLLELHPFSSNVKVIEANQFRGRALELDIVEYLVRNAKLLKQLNLRSARMSTEDTLRTSKRLSRLAAMFRHCSIALVFTGS
ncbi:hypothetical protein Ancab_020702 [Ancistrocladus abbreviatus]